MHSKLRPSPAMVVALVALFVALGGSAAALSGQNTVQTDDLGPGAQVTAPDVAANAVNGSDVVDNSLTGADVNELTLGKVPNGDRLDGLDSTAFIRGRTLARVWSREGAAVHYKLATVGPYDIKASCSGGGTGVTAVELYVNGPPGWVDRMVDLTENDISDLGTRSSTTGIPANADTSFEFALAAGSGYRRVGGTALIQRFDGSGSVIQVYYQAVANSGQQLCSVFGIATTGTPGT